jgi:hypothetical protein
MWHAPPAPPNPSIARFVSQHLRHATLNLLSIYRLFGAHYDGSSASRCGGAKIISQIILVGGGSGGVLSGKEQAEAEQWQVDNVVVLLCGISVLFSVLSRAVGLISPRGSRWLLLPQRWSLTA